MGVIKRQSIKTSLVEIMGIIVGFFSMLYIYPLNDEAFGYIQFLVSSGMLMIPFLSFGISAVTIKFFSLVDDNVKAKSGFLLFLFLISLVPTILFFFAFVLFESKIFYGLELLKFNVTLFSQNKVEIFLIGLTLTHVGIYMAYLSNFGKIAFPSFVKEFGFKIAAPILVLLSYYGIVGINTIGYLILLFYVLVLAILLLYGIRDRVVKVSSDFSFFTKNRLKEVSSFSFYSSLTYLSSLLAFRIDLIMVAALLSLTSNGIYAKILIISSVISLPDKVLRSTVSPSLAKSWNIGDVLEINKLYKIAGTNMLIYGLLLFLIIWFSIENLFLISSNPASFENGKILFLYLGLGKLLDLLSSINGTIIGYSASYRVNFIFIITLGISNVVLNYILINKFDIVGAAMATCLAFLIYNFLKVVFLYLRYNIHPFSIATIKSIVLAFITFGIISYLPTTHNPFGDIILSSLLIGLLFLGSIILLKVSNEISELANQIVKRALVYIRK